MRQESQHIYDTMYTTRLENQNDTSLCEAGNFIEQNYCALATGSLEVGNRKQEETRRIYRFGYVKEVPAPMVCTILNVMQNLLVTRHIHTF